MDFYMLDGRIILVPRTHKDITEKSDTLKPDTTKQDSQAEEKTEE